MHRTVTEIKEAVHSSCMLHSFFSVMPANVILKTCLLVILSKHWRKLNWGTFKQAPQEAHSGTSSQAVKELFSSDLKQNKTSCDAQVQSELTNITSIADHHSEKDLLCNKDTSCSHQQCDAEQVILHISELTMPVFLSICATHSTCTAAIVILTVVTCLRIFCS